VVLARCSVLSVLDPRLVWGRLTNSAGGSCRFFENSEKFSKIQENLIETQLRRVRNREISKIQKTAELAELSAGLANNSARIRRNSVTCFINAVYFCIFDSIWILTKQTLLIWKKVCTSGIRISSSSFGAHCHIYKF
jgi:hypothetical protein